MKNIDDMKKWAHALKELDNLPKRDDTAYKEKKKKEQTKGFFWMLLISPIGILIGLVLVWVDLYTPAAIPFGWLLGLILAGMSGILMIGAPIGLLVSASTSSPRYEVTSDDVYKPLGGLCWTLSLKGIDKTICQVGEMAPIYTSLILPSQRDKIGNFLKTIHTTLKNEVHTEKRFRYELVINQEQERQDEDKGVKIGEIKISLGVQVASLNSNKFEIKDVAKLAVAAIKSSQGDWYLVLPEYNEPEKMLDYFCVCSECKRKADPFVLKKIEDKQYCPTCAAL